MNYLSHLMFLFVFLVTTTVDAQLLSNMDSRDFVIYDRDKDVFLLFVPYLPILRDSQTLFREEFDLGIIDSGVWKDHPQIKPHLMGYRDFTKEGLDDLENHGTVVILNILQDVYRKRFEASQSYEDVYNSELFIAENLFVAKIVHDATVDFSTRRHRTKVYKRLRQAIKWLSEKQAIRTIKIALGIKKLTGRQKRRLCRLIKDKSSNITFLISAANNTDLKLWPACCIEDMPILQTKNIVVVGNEKSECSNFVPESPDALSAPLFYDQQMLHIYESEKAMEIGDTTMIFQNSRKLMHELDNQFSYFKHLDNLTYLYQNLSFSAGLTEIEKTLNLYSSKYGDSGIMFNYFSGFVALEQKRIDEALAFFKVALQKLSPILIQNTEYDWLSAGNYKKEYLTEEEEKELMNENMRFALFDSARHCLYLKKSYCSTLRFFQGYKGLDWSNRMIIQRILKTEALYKESVEPKCTKQK